LKRLVISAVLLIGLIAQSAFADERRSGRDFMAPALQEMQADDTTNPAYLSVRDGEDLWNTAPEGNGKSCSTCHGSPAQSMAGIAARYPAFDRKLRRVINLDQRVQYCAQTYQNRPLAYESPELLALSAYFAAQSQGFPITPPKDRATKQIAALGRDLYFQRQGQINLSCSQCHDLHAGDHLAGAPIPQAHPTAYPLYRLEWQALGSLERRLRGCIAGVRAEVPAYGSKTLIALEAYLMTRAQGMAFEGPGVRP
jgi:sulfur-oxidizing protein SoxA